MEEMIIDSTITIAEGTQTRWKDKLIRLKNDCYVRCNGTLIMENCVIYSREKGYSGRILCKRKGQIIASSCKFLNYRHSTTSFFIEFEDSSAQFDGCTFINCTQYIKFNGDLIMTDCQFDNCLFNTVATRWASTEATCRLENIKIQNNIIPAEIKNAINNTYDYERRVFSIEAKKCIVSNITIEEDEEFSKKILKHRNDHYTSDAYIYTDGVIENVVMKNTTMSLWSKKLIQNSKFIKCISPVRTEAEMFRGHPTVVNCDFSECTQVILADHRTKVEECTFSHCYGNLLTQRQFSEDGNISIEKCHFLNCTNDAKEFNHIFRYLISSEAALLFFRGSKTSETSTVRNCLIKGMVLNEGFFVATETLYKTPGYIARVSNCTFEDCYTNRNDYEIFKRGVHYYGALGREKNDLSIQVRNCIGLDEIRNDFIDDFDELEFDEDDFDEQDLDNQTVHLIDNSSKNKKNIDASQKKQGASQNTQSDNPHCDQIMVSVAKYMVSALQTTAKTEEKHTDDGQFRMVIDSVWSKSINGVIQSGSVRKGQKVMICRPDGIEISGEVSYIIANCNMVNKAEAGTAVSLGVTLKGRYKPVKGSEVMSHSE